MIESALNNEHVKLRGGINISTPPLIIKQGLFKR